MTRFVAALLIAALVHATPAFAQAKWGNIKGTVVWAGDKFPKAEVITVTQDKAHCLAKGDLIDNQLVVNPTNKGVKSVLVWLVPMQGDMPIHPDLKAIKVKDVEIDQPMCMFVPRMVAIRECQTLNIKNSSPVPHNLKANFDGVTNAPFNVIIPPGKAEIVKGLKAENRPVMFECNLHTWMKGRLGIFAHPYYALTKEDGSFEILNAPVGNFRLFALHETGWVGGPPARKGRVIQIKEGANDLGKLELK